MFEKKTQEICDKFKRLEVELHEKYKKEMDDFIKEFNKVNKVPKPVADLKILQKNLEMAIKQKKYRRLTLVIQRQRRYK